MVNYNREIHIVKQMSFLIQSVMEWAGIASIPGFPFTLNHNSPRINCCFLYNSSSSSLVWILQEGVTHEAQSSSSPLLLLPAGSTISIFHVSLSDLSDEEKRLARNVLKRVRTLRIQGLLPCLGGVEYKEHIYIATEQCMPLAHYVFSGLPSLSLLLSSSSCLLGGSSSNASAVAGQLVTDGRKCENGIQKECRDYMGGVVMEKNGDKGEEEKILTLIQRELEAVQIEQPSDEEDEEGAESEEGMERVILHERQKERAKRDRSENDIESNVVDKAGGDGEDDDPMDINATSSRRNSNTNRSTSSKVSTAMTSMNAIHPRYHQQHRQLEWLCTTYSGVCPKTLALGLKTIAKAVHVLHTNNLHHGNIHPSCVFVMVRTGFWRLFGFEFISEMGEVYCSAFGVAASSASQTSSNGGGMGETGDHSTPAFLLGGRFFKFMQQKGEENEREAEEKHSFIPSFSSASRKNSSSSSSSMLAGVPPEFAASSSSSRGGEEVGWGDDAASCSGSNNNNNSRSVVEREGWESTPTPTSISSMSKLWHTFVGSSPTTTKSTAGSKKDPFFPILSSVLEVPWKAAAWDAWGLSQLCHLSHVALLLHVRARKRLSPLHVTSTRTVEEEHWHHCVHQLQWMAEKLGSLDPRARLEGSSSFANILNDKEVGKRDANNNHNKGGGSPRKQMDMGYCWSCDTYVKCMESTEMYPVLEAEEKDLVVSQIIKALYISLRSCANATAFSPPPPHPHHHDPSGGCSIAQHSRISSSSSFSNSSKEMGEKNDPFWGLFPFGGTLWMIERVVANLFSYIPRTVLLAILLLGQHLLLSPPLLDEKAGKMVRDFQVLGGTQEGAPQKEKKDESEGEREGTSPSLVQLAVDVGASASSSSTTSFSTAGKEWYDPFIGPLVVYMYSCRDKFIRLQLLESTPLYAPNLSSSRWNDEIWLYLSESFHRPMHTSLEALLAATKAAIWAAPFLSSAVLLQEVVPAIKKHLVCHGGDAVLRASGIQCVAQILPHIPPASRLPLAMEVYGKGVQDGNEMVRLVSAKGVQRCLHFMSPGQVAKHILPLISPLAVDPFAPSREVSWGVLQKSLMLFRSVYGGGGEDQPPFSRVSCPARSLHLPSNSVTSTPSLPWGRTVSAERVEDDAAHNAGVPLSSGDPPPSCHPVSSTPPLRSTSYNAGPTFITTTTASTSASSFSHQEKVVRHTSVQPYLLYPQTEEGKEGENIMQEGRQEEEEWSFELPKNHFEALRLLAGLDANSGCPIFYTVEENIMSRCRRRSSVSSISVELSLPPPPSGSTTVTEKHKKEKEILPLKEAVGSCPPWTKQNGDSDDERYNDCGRHFPSQYQHPLHQNNGVGWRRTSIEEGENEGKEGIVKEWEETGWGNTEGVQPIVITRTSNHTTRSGNFPIKDDRKTTKDSCSSVDPGKALRRYSIPDVVVPLTTSTFPPSLSEMSLSTSTDQKLPLAVASSPLSLSGSRLRGSNTTLIRRGGRGRRLSALRITVPSTEDGEDESKKKAIRTNNSGGGGEEEGEEEEKDRPATATTRSMKTHDFSHEDGRVDLVLTGSVLGVTGNVSTVSSSSSVNSLRSSHSIHSMSTSKSEVKGLNLGGKKRMGASLGARKCD